MDPMAVDDGETIRIGKRCYVGNLAWKTSWQDLKDTFREVGTVVYANVERDEDGRSKGWGIVEYETPEEAFNAINAFNDMELGGRRIMVREDREDRDLKQNTGHQQYSGRQAHREPSNWGAGDRGASRTPVDRAGESSGLQIVVQGLPWSYTWKELKDMFASVGSVERADVAIGYDGRSRGFGTVRFSNPAAAQRAINQWHEQDLEGRRLAVFFDKFA